MKRKMVIAFLAVCLLAIGINVYAVMKDGWYDSRSTIGLTVLIFGGVGLVWFVGDKLSRK